MPQGGRAEEGALLTVLKMRAVLSFGRSRGRIQIVSLLETRGKVLHPFSAA